MDNSNIHFDYFERSTSRKNRDKELSKHFKLFDLSMAFNIEEISRAAFATTFSMEPLVPRRDEPEVYAYKPEQTQSNRRAMERPGPSREIIGASASNATGKRRGRPFGSKKKTSSQVETPPTTPPLEMIEPAASINFQASIDGFARSTQSIPLAQLSQPNLAALYSLYLRILANQPTESAPALIHPSLATTNPVESIEDLAPASPTVEPTSEPIIVTPPKTDDEVEAEPSPPKKRKLYVPKKACEKTSKPKTPRATPLVAEQRRTSLLPEIIVHKTSFEVYQEKQVQALKQEVQVIESPTDSRPRSTRIAKKKEKAEPKTFVQIYQKPMEEQSQEEFLFGFGLMRV